MPLAVYAGSFDPVTAGHIDIARRAAILFDEVVFAVGHNPNKRYWFDLAQRVELIERSVAGDCNIRVVSFDGLLVDLCESLGAGVLVRGVRTTADVDLEMGYAMANRDLSGVETVFLAADPQHVFVSSSIVKEIASNGGDVSRYVPACVFEALTARAM